MNYLYVLLLGNDRLYIGSTTNLQQRIRDHKDGKALTTKKYLPVKVVYYECYLSRNDAQRRESMLKRYGSTYVHLKERIRDSLRQSQGRG